MIYYSLKILNHINAAKLVDSQFFSGYNSSIYNVLFVKLRQGSGKEGQGMALKAKGLKA